MKSGSLRHGLPNVTSVHDGELVSFDMVRNRKLVVDTKQTFPLLQF